METQVQNITPLVNYEFKTSNSNNYISETSADLDSFPSLMENGIIVIYEVPELSSTIIELEN